MIVDIANLNLHDRPVLILKNLDEKPVTNLGNAFNIRMDIAYNEVSSITFDIPAYVNGMSTPDYDLIVGTRLVDFVGVGMFILVDPETTGNGASEIKSCKAYSREYEMTYKKMSLPEGTYNFYNTVAPGNTILGIIREYLPYWSIGSVDSNLIGKYRTFSVSDVNIYDFIKNTCQKTYGCVFDFDTYNRRINVKSTSGFTPTNPVYLSTRNLAKEIERKEDTENIYTCLDVNGASGVTIRGVNPLGTNKIYNLDYYMNSSNFSQEMITKWNTWKRAVIDRQNEYFLLTIQRMLKTSEIVALEAKINEGTNAELGALEAQQSVFIEALARLPESSSGYAQALSNLTDINNQIAAKKSSIASDTASLSTLEAEKDALTASLEAINDAVAFETYFTNEEILLLKQYFKEDAITESSFVYSEAKNYSSEDLSRSLSGVTTSVTSSRVETAPSGVGSAVYKCEGGNISVGSMLSAAVISATAEYVSGTLHAVLTAYLGAGTVNGISFPNGCLTIVTDGGTASSVDDSVTLSGGSGSIYFTRNTTEYEKYSVEWDLYEYGVDCLSKLAYPSYSFSVDSANFFTMDEFAAFKNSIVLGEKIYLDMNNETLEEYDESESGSLVGSAIVGLSRVGMTGSSAGYSRMLPLRPIFIGFSIDFEDPSSLSLKFGDKYNQSDASFTLVDLLEQSVSMGKTVDTSRFGYNAFIDSGASTAVKDYMDSALDVAKQSILSSTGVAIEWDESGMTFRKKKTPPQTGYEDTQIKIINDNIVFTDDAWQTAKMAIGHFVDTNAGDSWGVIAPNVVGTLLAGENLVIESSKQDGGVAVFKVDADGAVLHNSTFDIVRSNYDAQTGQAISTSTHILLDPDLGFGLGTYPVKNSQTGDWDTTRAKFWVDMQGNVHIAGTLEGADGTFSGSLSAATGTFAGSLSAATGTFAGDISAASGTFTGTIKASHFLDGSGNEMFVNNKFQADYLNLKGITITDNNNNTTFSVDSNGNVTVNGSVTMGSGSTISWGSVTQSGGTATLNSDFGNPNTVAGAVASDAGDALRDAGDALSAAQDASTVADGALYIADRIANGTYTGTTINGQTYTATFINGTSIFSPLIYANTFTAIADSVSAQSGQGAFVMKRGSNVGTTAFQIYYWNNQGWEAHLAAESQIVIDNYTRFLDDVTFEDGTGTVRYYGRIALKGGEYGTSSQRPSNPETGTIFFQLDS